MSENMQCHMFVRNTTGGPLVLLNTNLPWGKWMNNYPNDVAPPTTIANGQVAGFAAQGAKGSATGTQGSVQYMYADNQTSFTINFDVPYSGSNSGGASISGPGMQKYSIKETDSSYLNVVSFPSSGSSVTVYFAAGMAGMLKSMAPGGLTKTVAAKFASLSQTPQVPTLDIATVARTTDCGELSAKDLLRLFAGKMEVDLGFILAVDKVPAADLVGFVANRGLMSSFDEIQGCLDLAENVLPVLKGNDTASSLAQKVIAALRAQLKGADPGNLDELADGLEAVKAGLLATRTAEPPMAMISAIEAVLAPIYMDSGAAFAQAASCARNAATADRSYEAISSWQLDYLKKLVK